jgi:Abnormal spindle-like microcephaly-assoc'd, ASPM-SPD-2-Hydin
VLSLHSARRRNPLRRLSGSGTGLLAIALCCLVVAALSGCGYAVNGSTTGLFHVAPEALTFGAVPVGQTATSSVTVLNESSASVDISQLNVAGQSFFLNSQGSLPVTVPVGSTYSFVIGFKPGGESSYSGQFTVMSTAGKPIAQGSISGSGISGSGSNSTPELTVSSASLAFGNVTLNTASMKPVTLTSTGTAPVTINSGTLSGAGFTMSGAAFPVTLNPTQSVTLNVQFDPATAGAATGEVTVQSNSSTNGTVVVHLSGTGTSVSSPQSSSPQLTIDPASLAFGNVTLNTASTLPVTLTSSGTAPVTINSATSSGGGFTVSGATLPATLNPNQSVTLNVQFDPATAGTATGQLTIQSNSSTNGTAVVDLSGTGTTPSSPQSASPQLTISATSLTFGDVTVNTASTQPVTLTSTGTAPVTVNSATLSGAGFTVSGVTLPATLNPNQSLTLNVQFDPTAAGAATGQLTIQSNSATNSTAVVNLSGTGTAMLSPQLTISVASLTFGDVTVNTASTQPVTLTSTGTAPVTINSATLTGAGFTVSGATFPVTLNPKQSVTLNVQFDPTAAGTVTGQVTIQSNSATNSTAVVNLSGTGTAVSSPQLTVSAASLTFGDVTVNTASTQPVTLTSTGTAPVTIKSATLSGAGFTVSGATFPVTLSPGQSVTLNVQFDPATAGAATGQLTIQSESSTNSTAVVNLSGTGTAVLSPQLTISAASLTFGDVTVNTASTQPVTLTSTGTAPVTVDSAVLTGTGFTLSGATFPVTLNPTQSVTLNVQFDPAAAGAATGRVTIQSDSSTNSTAVVNLSGTGTAASSPQLTISAASLTFGNVTVDTASTQPVTLTSTGTAPVTINSGTPSGTGFTMSGATFPVTLNPTQSVTLNVQFDPVTTGPATGQVTIQSNSSTNSTAVVNLSGTGAAASSPQLVVSAASLAFGNVTLNTASTLPVTLTSTGTAPVTINSGTLSGTGFTMSGATFPVTLNPTQSVTLNVQFDPATAGAVTGQVTIQSNSSTNGTAVISLTGTGTAGSGALSGLSCSSGSMTGSGSDTCTVTLSAAAGSGGLSVGLTSSNAAVTVPATVVIPANATTAGFTATVSSVTTEQAVTLTASAGSVSKTFTLQLNAAVPNLTVSSTSLAFGNVTLNTASTLPVTLTSTGTAPVTVNSGALSGTGFTMPGATFPVTLNPTQSATLNVRFDPTAAGAVTGQLTIQSNSSTNGTTVIGLSGTGTAVSGTLSSVSCSSASLTGAGSDSCTVTLSSAAGSGGVSVGLSSSSTAVTVPATVVVPGNATSAGFTATVTSVTTAQSVTLTASTGGVSKTFALQLNAAAPTLTISPASLAFGNVTVNTPTTLPVTLSSTGSAPVTINSATLSGTGFTMSGATFPVTLNPGLAITLEVQFDPTATGAVTGQLVIQSNSSTNGTVTIGLSGTGENASHQVTLTWDAPGSSTDPVAGYNVYRSTGGSSAYNLLNSSVDAQATYVDTNVQSGATYDYIVKSVDASGVESIASNEATATIP